MIRADPPSRWLALAGIVGPVVWWVLVVVNGAITPGYSHVSDYISTLGAVDAPYATIQAVNFAVFGGAILALALGIHRWFDDVRRPRVGTALLGVFGVGVILAGVFPGDPSAPDSTTHILHNVTSIVAFVTGIGGVALLSRRVARDDRWPTYPYEVTWIVVVVFVTFAAFMGSIFTDSAFVGFTQRAFVGVLTVWVAMQSYRLYRLLGAAGLREPDKHRPMSGRRRTLD